MLKCGGKPSADHWRRREPADTSPRQSAADGGESRLFSDAKAFSVEPLDMSTVAPKRRALVPLSTAGHTATRLRYLFDLDVFENLRHFGGIK